VTPLRPSWRFFRAASLGIVLLGRRWQVAVCFSDASRHSCWLGFWGAGVAGMTLFIGIASVVALTPLNRIAAGSINGVFNFTDYGVTGTEPTEHWRKPVLAGWFGIAETQSAVSSLASYFGTGFWKR